MLYSLLICLLIKGVVCDHGSSIYDSNWKGMCKYELNKLTCQTVIQVDIKQVFVELAKSPEFIGNKWIESLNWNAPLLNNELPERVFNDFKIKYINFEFGNIERIHSNAFLTSPENQITESFECFKSCKLKSNFNHQYNFYSAFGSMSNLKVLFISLDENSEHDIPDKAFEGNNWSGIESIKISTNDQNKRFTISRIGNNLFDSLPATFNRVSFAYVKIKNIAANAFQLKKCTICNPLTIYLLSTELNENSLEPGAFDIPRSHVTLYLDNNKFKTVPKEVFQSFLSKESNEIYIQDNHIDCSQKQKHLFDWVLNHREYESKILGLFCADGKTIWDFDWTTEESDDSSTTTKPVLKCNENDEYDGKYGVDKWPVVNPGDYAIVNCLNVNGAMKWMCLDNRKFDDNGPEIDECWLDNLLHKKITSVEDVKNYLDIIIRITDKISLKSMDSLKTILVLIKKFEVFIRNKIIDPLVAEKLTENFIWVFSQTIDQSKAWENGTDTERLETASQLLLYIQLTSFTTNCYLNEENKTKEFISNNIYEKLYYNLTESKYFEYNQNNINIPKESEFVNIEENNYSCKEKMSFGAVINSLNQYLTKGLDISQQMNSKLIAFSLRNSNQSFSLKKGSNNRITLKHKNRLSLGDQIKCVYWNFSSLKWSTEGCNLVNQNSDKESTVCECNHLTNFAAIMDLSGRETDGKAKNIVTQVFCSLSVISLLITIVFIIKRRKSPKLSQRNLNEITKKQMERRDFILVNKIICLLITNLIIMIGMDRTDQKVICHMISFFLLYFLLSTFVWMSLHGFHLYRMTHNVFSFEPKGYIFLAIGYILPLLISLIGLLILWPLTGKFGTALVGSDYFCWISSPKHPNNLWILIGPALFMILFNFVIICFLWYVVIKTKNNPNKSKQKKSYNRQIFGFLCLILNLGLVWTLFLAYIHRLSVAPNVFSYIFIVINGSQGVFILIYYLATYFN